MGRTSLFDNTNNFYSIPFETSKDEVECISCAQDLSESRYLYDFSMIKIKNLAPFLQVEGEDAIGVKNLLKGLKKLPPAVRDSLIQVKLVSEDEILAQCGMNAWGCEYGGTVWIPDSGPSWPTGIYHEAAHARTDQLQSEIIKHEVGEEYISYTSYALELKRKYNQEYKPRVRFYTAEGENTENFCESCSVKVVWPNEDGTRLIEKPGVVTETEKKEIAELWSNYYFTDIGPDSRKSNFEKKWEVVAGPVYGEGLGEKIVAGHNAAKWKDGTDAPKNGVIMAYGANNFWEDVATFVEPFAEKNHDFFKQYISPSSPQYDGRYEEKLKLLYEYGFITEMDYLDVMSYKEE